jgi:hypothetical protein
MNNSSAVQKAIPYLLDTEERNQNFITLCFFALAKSVTDIVPASSDRVRTCRDSYLSFSGVHEIATKAI